MSKINETNYPRRTPASYEDTDMLGIQAAGGNTYTTRLEDMREDYEETLAPTLSALQDDVNENLATVEESTASKAYAKGDFLIFGGRLCKAKTSIASGATLVLDTNIELDSVGDELSSLSSDLTSITAAMNTCFDKALDTAAGWKTKALSSPLRKFVTLRAYISGSTTLCISTMPKAVFDLYGTTNPIRLMGTNDSDSLYVASSSGQNFRTYNATGIANLKLAVYTQD